MAESRFLWLPGSTDILLQCSTCDDAALASAEAVERDRHAIPDLKIEARTSAHAFRPEGDAQMSGSLYRGMGMLICMLVARLSWTPASLDSEAAELGRAT